MSNLQVMKLLNGHWRNRMVNLYRGFTARISADTADNFPSNDNIYLSFELPI